MAKRTMAVAVAVLMLAITGIAQSVDELISQAQALFPVRYEIDNLRAAIDLYEKALALAPERADLLATLSRLHYELGIATDDPGEERASLRRGADLGFAALRLGGLAQAERTKLAAFQEKIEKAGDVAAVYWAAKNWGMLTEIGGLSAKLSAIFRGMPGKVKALYLRAIKIDETYFGGGPHEDYGALLASFTQYHLYGATLDEAREHFDRAIEIASQVGYLMPYVTYAHYYAIKTHDRALFEELLGHVMDSPIGDWPFWNRIAKRDAAALLDEEGRYFR